MWLIIFIIVIWIQIEYVNKIEFYILTENTISDLSFAIRTKNQMGTWLPFGSILIVDTGIEVLEGDLVIIHYNQSNESTIREVIYDGPKMKLLSLNINSALCEIDFEYSIIKNNVIYFDSFRKNNCENNLC